MPTRHAGHVPTPRSIQRTYLVLLLGNTLAASFIWGINTIFLLDAGLSNLEAFAANAFFTAGMVLVRSRFDSDIPRKLRGWWIAGWTTIHVLVSVALLTWPTALAEGWWTEIDPAWRPSALTDQRHAAVVFLLVGLMTAGAIAVWALARASRSPSPVLQAENSDS